MGDDQWVWMIFRPGNFSFAKILIPSMIMKSKYTRERLVCIYRLEKSRLRRTAIRQLPFQLFYQQTVIHKFSDHPDFRKCTDIRNGHSIHHTLSRFWAP